MKLEDVIAKFEEFSPADFAESWDNSGLMCGRHDKEIRSVLLAVDATDAVTEDAVLTDADLLLTHHPLIFPSISHISDKDIVGRRLLKLIAEDVACYAMHTNFDVVGMADEAADRIELSGRKVLMVTHKDQLTEEGIGRAGELPYEMTLKECAEMVKEVFMIDNVRIFGDPERKVKRAAISPGSGKHMSRYAIEAGSDVLISGDIDHHEGIDAVAAGLAVIDAGHFGLEKIFCPYMKDFIMREMPGIQVSIASENAPFTVI